MCCFYYHFVQEAIKFCKHYSTLTQCKSQLVVTFTRKGYMTLRENAYFPKDNFRLQYFQQKWKQIWSIISKDYCSSVFNFYYAAKHTYTIIVQRSCNFRMIEQSEKKTWLYLSKWFGALFFNPLTWYSIHTNHVLCLCG